MNVNSIESKPLIGGEVEKPQSCCESRRSVCNQDSHLLLETISWIKGWTLGTWIRLFLLLVVIAAIVVAIVVFKVQKYFPDVLNFIERLGIWGKLVFIGIYIVATVCFIPGSVLTLGGGFLFGLYWGTLIVWIGAVIGCVLSFLLGRTVLRSWIEKKVDQYPTFSAVDAAIGEQGWKLVLLLRLAPVIPFNLLNYALALTKVAVIHYIWSSAFGMLPGTVLYVYIGSLASGISAIAGGQTKINPVQQIVIWSVSGVIIIVVVVFVTIIARKAIKKAIAEQEAKQEEEATYGDLA